MPKIDLHCTCPCDIESCSNKYRKTYWYHNNCGGKTQLDTDNINICCSKCYTGAIIFDWLFRTSSHNFVQGSLQGWFNALASMSQSVSDSTILIDVTQKLIDAQKK